MLNPHSVQRNVMEDGRQRLCYPTEEPKWSDSTSHNRNILPGWGTDLLVDEHKWDVALSFYVRHPIVLTDRSWEHNHKAIWGASHNVLPKPLTWYLTNTYQILQQLVRLCWFLLLSSKPEIWPPKSLRWVSRSDFPVLGSYKESRLVSATACSSDREMILFWLPTWRPACAVKCSSLLH